MENRNKREICCHCKYYDNVKLYCAVWEQRKSSNDTCYYFTKDIPIDWEQRRYEIAKEMLPFCVAEYSIADDFRLVNGANYAVECADILIEKLKKCKNIKSERR